jgi:hypothetical protein
MTPQEIAQRFGDETLARIYDYILSAPAYQLADWILSLYSPADIQILIDRLDENEIV